MQETQEMQVQSLRQEDPLEKEMASGSSILAWKIPWTEKPGGLQSMGVTKSDTTELLHHTFMQPIRRMSMSWSYTSQPPSPSPVF